MSKDNEFRAALRVVTKLVSQTAGVGGLDVASGDATGDADPVETRGGEDEGLYTVASQLWRRQPDEPRSDRGKH